MTTTSDHDPGPYFDDFTVGQALEPAPDLTIGPGDVAVYQAICGDPLRLPLSHPLSQATTGRDQPLVNPGLVMHVSIGQSTVATQRVIANLFYRGVVLQRPVFVGDTLSTRVTILGLRENRPKPDRPLRGMVLLGITTVNQHGEVVVDYERCPMVRFRGDQPTGHADDLGPAESPLDLDTFTAACPDWDLTGLPPSTDWAVGEVRPDHLRDTVTTAPELARLTQNLAPVHRDATLGQGGVRLVYGGHTIGLAQASLARLCPSIATVVGWSSCDHIGPVFEGDVLAFRSELLAETEVANGRLRAFSVRASTTRDGEPTDVLDFRPVVLTR